MNDPPDKCPKCGSKWTRRYGVMFELDWFACGSWLDTSDGEFNQTPQCRIQHFEAVVTKIDRMASAQLTNGIDEVKPFAQEIFDLCEQAINE